MRPPSVPMLKDVCNYPNPAPGAGFSDSTVFGYFVAEDSAVCIKIYNIIGQLADEIRHEGRGGIRNEIGWNISHVASGVYFYVVEATGSSGEIANSTGKLVIIK